MLATGGGDSLVNIWEDCTAADNEEERKKEVSTNLLNCVLICDGIFC